MYVGLAAQLPIALLGFLAARALLRVADEAARALAPRPAIASEQRLVADAAPRSRDRPRSPRLRPAGPRTSSLIRPFGSVGN